MNDQTPSDNASRRIRIATIVGGAATAMVVLVALLLLVSPELLIAAGTLIAAGASAGAVIVALWPPRSPAQENDQ